MPAQMVPDAPEAPERLVTDPPAHPRGTQGPASAPPGLMAGTDPASGRGWDELGERERRERVDAMSPDGVRAYAVSMPLIEQAKGVVMGCYSLDAATAFAVLRRLSSTRNVKLREVAAEVVAAAASRAGSAREPRPLRLEQVCRLLLDPSADDQEGRP